MYVIVSNNCAAVGIYMVACLAARNMDIFKNLKCLCSWNFSCRRKINYHMPAFIAKMYNM
jgi:hypothetical protein